MSPQYSRESLEKVIDSARRLNVELDEQKAVDWLEALRKAKNHEEDIAHCERTGVFGQQIVMLDFSPERLAYYRQIGGLVEFFDEPGRVETALALSGSSAQSKFQLYPGDCDYFERVNIIAPTKEEACQVLAEIMREKALSTTQGPTYHLMEVKMGTYSADFIKEKQTFPMGSPISWAPDEIEAGKKVGLSADGKPLEILWDAAAQDSGWCKLDWVVADPITGTLANASNMLDVTWEAPDGSITPLDGYLDPYFQEIYLQAESAPIFAKLSQHVSADALNEYVKALEGEVYKYVTKQVNYGKAAKRMYNIFRLTGQYSEAVFLRELFDEPASMLYQVWSVIRTLDEAIGAEAPFETEQLIKQTENLMMEVIRVMEDAREAEIIKRILRFRDAIHNMDSYEMLTAEAEAARDEVLNVVNNFFFEKMTAIPEIKTYIDNIQTSPR